MATKATKWTKAADDKADKKAGIKENSKRDKALDKKRGVTDAPGKKTAPKVGPNKTSKVKKPV